MDRSPTHAKGQLSRFWKNQQANIGSGLFLMLPLVIAFYILGRLWGALHAPVRALATRLGLDGFLGVNGLLLLSALLLLVVLALVGHLVRVRGEGKLRKWAERKLLNHVPGYTYIRVILEARLGLAEPPSVHPVLFEVGDGWQPAFLVERCGDGRCVVYIPDVPLPSSGSVLLVEGKKITLLGSSVVPLDTALRRYGQGMGELIGQIAPKNDLAREP